MSTVQFRFRRYRVYGGSGGSGTGSILHDRVWADSMADFEVLIGDFIDSYYNLTMKTFVVHRFASTRCQSAKWIIVHDDDAVIRWKLLVDKLRGNTVQYNFNCLYSPPVNEFPMRYGQNNVARKFE